MNDLDASPASLPGPAWLCHAVLATALASLVAAGCSGKKRELPPLGRVAGVVTLDGAPLSRAAVAFVPYERGNASYATTDAEGRYTLRYTDRDGGAVVGRHRVEIRTGGEGRDADGNLVETPERVPARYHATSELLVEVVAGDNTLDFTLVTGPEKRKSSR